MDMETFEPKGPGSQPIPYYMALRMWRAYDLAAPSKDIQISTNSLYFPFSIKPDAPVTRLAMIWQRFFV